MQDSDIVSIRIKSVNKKAVASLQRFATAFLFIPYHFCYKVSHKFLKLFNIRCVENGVIALALAKTFKRNRIKYKAKNY